MIATARILFPESIIRLSAGRTQMSKEAQALCFFAGASSIFAGDKLLTTPNPAFNEDKELFDILGLTPKAPFQDGEQPETKYDAGVEAAREYREKIKAASEKTPQKSESGFEPRKIVVE